MPLVVRLQGVTSHSFARRLELVSSPVRRAGTRKRMTTAAAGRVQRITRLLVLAGTACELILGSRLGTCASPKWIGRLPAPFGSGHLLLVLQRRLQTRRTSDCLTRGPVTTLAHALPGHQFHPGRVPPRVLAGDHTWGRRTPERRRNDWVHARAKPDVCGACVFAASKGETFPGSSGAARDAKVRRFRCGRWLARLVPASGPIEQGPRLFISEPARTSTPVVVPGPSQGAPKGEMFPGLGPVPTTARSRLHVTGGPVASTCPGLPAFNSPQPPEPSHRSTAINTPAAVFDTPVPRYQLTESRLNS